MSDPIRIERLTEANFADYEKLTSCESGGGCYCAFWHQKWTSMDGWDERKKTAPIMNRETVRDRVRSGFHVGVLAYRGADLVAWISVGPLIDFYWTWRRVVQVGEASRTTAGIVCMTVSPSMRKQGLQPTLLNALKEYGKAQGWTALEGYPFDTEAVEKHRDGVIWPGLGAGFSEAGFERVGPHWLNFPDYPRSIYQVSL